MAAQLIITEPSGRKRIIPLQKGSEVSIGRGTGNDLILTDLEISRKHCTVRWDDAGIRLEDHSSQNHTFVNSKQVKTSRLLKDGDVISAGNCTIRVVTLWQDKGVGSGTMISRRLIAAAVVAVMLAIGTAAGFFAKQFAEPSSPPPIADLQPEAYLTIKSTPPGAMAFVNNEYANVTPVEISCESGTYSVRLVLSGYEPYSQVVEMAGQRRNISARLKPIKPAFIEITSEPPDAEVMLDGAKVGRSPITVETIPGTHEIVIQKTNYIPWKGTVEAPPGQTLKVAGEMEHRSIATYLKMLEDDPCNVSYYCQLAHFFILEKRWAEAYDALRSAMETYCQNKDTSNYAARMKWLFDKIYFGDYFDVADKEKHDEIRQWIESLYAEMIREHPAHKATLTQWLSGILKRAGRADELRAIVQHGPKADDLKIYFQAADIYLGKGRYERAVGILNKAVNLGPKSFEARRRLGRAYLLWCKQGKREVKSDALKNLEKALQLCNDEIERKKIKALRREAAEL